MDLRRSLAALLLLAGPAMAQTAPKPAAATTPPRPAASAPAADATQASTTQAPTPAPMPDPLMSPDLQRQSRPLSLSSLVQQSTWQDPVIAAARAQFKELPDACAAAQFKPTGELTIFAPPQFDDQGRLQQAIWSERVTVTGCGAGPRALNVLTVLQPGTAPARIPTMPGTTHADPATQKGALQYAQAVAVRASPPNCRQQSFIDTKFDGYTGLPNPEVKDGRDGRAWREIWTLYACGATYDIGLTFTPNAQGTSLAATNPVKHS